MRHEWNMSVLKYFSWKKTTSATKEIVYELPDPAGSLAIGILSSTITAANEIKAAVFIA